MPGELEKSAVAKEFASNEYESFILIDFSKVSKEVGILFDDVSDLKFLFLQLQLQYKTDLHEKKSVIIFDEVQLCPMARQVMNYYTMLNEVSNHNYEIDFLVTRKNKICQIEVDSSGYRTHKSLDVFTEKFSHRILNRYLVYRKDMDKE